MKYLCRAVTPDLQQRTEGRVLAFFGCLLDSLGATERTCLPLRPDRERPGCGVIELLFECPADKAFLQSLVADRWEDDQASIYTAQLRCDDLFAVTLTEA